MQIKFSFVGRIRIGLGKQVARLTPLIKTWVKSKQTCSVGIKQYSTLTF